MLLSNSRRLLLKNQLHLNLNVMENVYVDNDDSAANARSIAAAAAAASAAEATTEGNNVETVTTVPKQQEQQQFNKQHIKIEATTLGKTTKTTTTRTTRAAAAAVATSLSSSPSLLNSSSTALAKFNRIIDSTVPVTNCYQQSQQVCESRSHATGAPALSSALQQRLALVYPDIVSTDSQSKKINFTTATTTARTAKPIRTKAKVKAKAATLGRVPNSETSAAASSTAKASIAAGAGAAATASNDDNQMKRNDVHYLLKQLNSFSDIEEIEIVDMEQRQQQLELQLQQQQQQQHQHVAGSEKPHSPTATSLVIISPSSQSHKGIRRYASLHQQQCGQHSLADDVDVDSVEQQQYLLQQFDDYLFQSCHYLETNNFAANYRTAMVESSSHEFRPSTTTGTSETSESSGQSLELYETEPPSVICKAAPPSAATPTPTPSPPPISLSPPVACEAAAAAALTATTATLQRYQMQTRLTSSGVQTELTATTSLLSAAATDASLAKSSSSSGGSEEQRRRTPFFKCCYTPIDRWREKRTAATHKRSESGRASGSGCGAAGPQHGRKNGHAV